MKEFTRFLWLFIIAFILCFIVLFIMLAIGKKAHAETCTAKVPYGKSVTLQAQPCPGSYFAGWGGACSGKQATCTVTVKSDTNVTADFELIPDPQNLRLRALSLREFMLMSPKALEQCFGGKKKGFITNL